MVIPSSRGDASGSGGRVGGTRVGGIGGGDGGGGPWVAVAAVARCRSGRTGLRAWSSIVG